jgi:hypothetical protein
MTYQQIKYVTEGFKLPIIGENEHGENVILSQGVDSRGHRFYHQQTMQANGWVRINRVYETGETSEEYIRSNK